jgi:hypothetical protein
MAGLLVGGMLLRSLLVVVIGVCACGVTVVDMRGRYV